jgi:type IV pilus biogenesis protein PilP
MAQASAPLTVGDIDAVLQEEIYFKALVERNRAEAELNKARGVGASANLQQPAAPQLVWRRATADGWVAKLQFSSGATALVRTGDNIPGGFKAIRVNADAVVVVRGAEEITLSPAVTNTKTSQAGDERSSLGAQTSRSALPAPSVPPTLEGRFPSEPPR